MEIRKHFGHYISLFAILGIGVATLYFSSDRSFQILVLTLTIFFYVLWGIVHHLLHHDLTSKIVVEYVLMGALGEALIFLIFKGGLGL